MPPRLAPNGMSPAKGKGPVVSQPPSPAATVTQNASKKKKKKKGKGRAATDADATLVDYHSRDMLDDDEDELPALEPCNGTQPSIPKSRTGLSPDLESVHLSSTATLSASARGKPSLNMSSAQQAEFLNELYRKMDFDPATAMADEVRDSLDALPGGMREFVQTALAGMAGLGLGENEVRQRTLYAIAQQMLSGGLGSLRSGLANGNGNGGGGNPNGRATQNSFAFEQNIPDSLVNEFQRLIVGAGKGMATAGQTQLQANVMLSHGFIDEDEPYAEGDYSEDEVDERVEDMEDMAQMRRSITRNNAHYSVSYEEEFIGPPGAYPMNPPEQYDYTAKNKRKKKKKKNAEPLQPVSPPQVAPNPTPPPARHGVTSPPPNPVAAVPPSSTPMPAPRTANPPPSSRAAGKQPMSYAPTTATTNSVPLNNPPRSARAAAKAPAPPQNYNAHNHPHHHPSPPSSNASVPQKHRPPAGNTQTAPVPKTNNKIWSTNTSEERERIKEFWLGLGEEDRRALVKIEKETVLKKMKEQQKHSCTCAVCGRKRHAIEEELEVLYDAYYEELEQYANYQQQYASSGGALPPPPGPGPFPGSVELDKNGLIIGPGGKTHPAQPRIKNTLANGKKIQESEFDEDDPEAEDYDEDEYEDEEEEEDEEDEDDIDAEDDVDGRNRGVRRNVVRDRGRVPNGKANGREDFFSFGSSFTVAGPGNILTVADDLLKNDGQKFLEMMEQLAERRMQREEEAAGDIEDESEEEEDEEGDEGEDEEDEEDEEEDEEEEMTEEQKVEDGKRMFSIFAARMFEQRVLQAYREKVAQERQMQLLRELEDEDKLTKEKEAKKAKENQKKKDKKKQQKLAKEEEKAAKAAERAAEEAALKEQQRRQEEEQRKRKEEERLKREALRRAQEEERQKKEEDRRRRIAEEKEREAEREKKRREKKEKEERLKAERREREEKERKAKEEREAKLAAEKAEKERVRREQREQQEKEERERRLAKEKEEKEKEAKEKERIAALQQQQQQRAAAASAAAAAVSTVASPSYGSSTTVSKARPPTSPRSSSASSGSSRQQPPSITPKKLLNRPSSSLPSAAPIAIPLGGVRQQTRPQQMPMQFSSPATPQSNHTPQYPSPTTAANLPPTTPIFAQNGPIPAPLLSPRMQQYATSVPPVPSYSYGSVHGISGLTPSLAPSGMPRSFGAPPPFDLGIGRGLGAAAPIGPPKVGLVSSIGSPTSLGMPSHGPPAGLPPPIRRPSAAADNIPGPITRPTPIARPVGGEASTSGSGSGTTSPSRRSPSPKVLGSSALAADDDEVVTAAPRRAVMSVPVGAGWHSPRNSVANATSAAVWGVNPHPGPGLASPRPPWSATPIIPFQDWQQAQAQQMYGMPFTSQTTATPPGN